MSDRIFKPTRGRIGRYSTKRHRRLCARTGHRAGVKSWFQKVEGGEWTRCAEPWCPRCQRPVVFHFDDIPAATIYVAGPQVEAFASPKLIPPIVEVSNAR